MLLFLIGLPGSGKTTLGKQLASILKFSFIDLDKEIVRRNNLSIDEIFKQHGEPAFRQMEKEALHSLSNGTSQIVATGGGAACFFDNMDWMNANGITLFLNPPLEELASRLSATKNTHRPMLSNLPKEETLLFLEQKIKERGPFYTQAKLQLSLASPTVNDIKVLLTNNDYNFLFTL